MYNRIPRPDIRISYRATAEAVLGAVRASYFTSLGQWKSRWNVGPHHVRTRTRNLVAEACRKHLDKYDYEMVEHATARTIATSVCLLPGGHLLHAFIHHCNHPVLRHCDRSLDILQHKIQEYLEREISYKQAEMALKRQQIKNPA